MTIEVNARRKRLLPYFLRALLALALLEVSSFAAYWVLFGRAFVPSRVDGEKRTIATGAIGEDVQGQLSQLYVVPHPFVGYVWDQDKVNSAPGWTEHDEGHPINAYGFMDRSEFLQERGDDRLLVGITGGSVAWWFSAQGDEALANGLRLAPGLAGRDIRVVRLGAGGYKQPQQLMILTYLLALGGELDVLINLDGYNEVVLSVIDDLDRGVYPFYPREWDRLVGDLPDVETKRRVGRLVFTQDLRQRWSSAFDGSLARVSPTLQLAWSVRDRWLERAIRGARGELQSYTRAEQPYAVRGPGVAGYAGGDALAEIARVWMQCSIQMDRVCRANGIRYLHFLQPNQYVAGSKPMGDEERKIAIVPVTGARTGVEQGYPKLLDLVPGLVAAGVDFHDLRMVFREVEEPLYIDPYCHVNRHANEILGARIAADVLASFGASVEFRGFSDVPERVQIVDPSRPVRLSLGGSFGESERRLLAPAHPGLVYSSSDPSVVSVSSHGELEAHRLGSATITARLEGHEARVPVHAMWGPVVEYGTASSTSSVKPRLHVAGGVPRRGDPSFQLELDAAPRGWTGALVVSDRPLIEGADPASHNPEALVLPLPDSAAVDGKCNIPLPIPDDADLEGRPTFCRVFFVSGAPGTDPIWSNGVALTVPRPGG